MITRIASLIVTVLFCASSAQAAANWQAVSFRTDPQNVPKLIAAIDTFMATDVGKAMPGTLSLMASVIDGSDPATHSVITSMDSMAVREAWNQQAQGTAAWTALLDTFVELTDLGSTSRLIFQKSWGEGGAGDVVWHLYAVTVRDPVAYLKAMDQLMASPTGSKFPGSLWLSSVAAAGMGTTTHVVSVGFQSEAEGETWNETMLPSADWAAFQKATDAVSTFQGAYVLRLLKSWGTATPAP